MDTRPQFSSSLPPPRSPNLPRVDARTPQLTWLDNVSADLQSSHRSNGGRMGSAQSISVDFYPQGSLRDVSIDPFTSYKVNDLTNYTMNDLRWTLQRKKIGLKRRTKATRERRVQNRKSKDLYLSFIRTHFRRKECVRYMRNPNAKYEGHCFCGESPEKHLPPSVLMHPPTPTQSALSVRSMSIQTVITEEEEEEEDSSDEDKQVSQRRGSLFGGLNFGALRSNALAPITLPTITSTLPRPLSVQNSSDNNDDENSESTGNPINELLVANGITSRQQGRDKSSPMAPERGLGWIHVEGQREKWGLDTDIMDFPTNAYGTITFTNETAGSNKPAKYVRLADNSRMDHVLTLLTDYWHLMDPVRPQLVISVTGGAKNFNLDGKKKAIFSSGLIKAVKSTNAWILTGGMHVGVMKIVGEAVNQGQYIVKIKRKSFFAEERDHLVRGIRCLGVLPWGYIHDRKILVNNDVNKFSSVRYKVEEKVESAKPISLNGDHTHFLFVDDGRRNKFQGVDEFRTELEEAIKEGEPRGLGVPVVLLLLEGGINSIVKCALALRRNIPIVVVAGTGRAADILAYAVSMTIQTPSGRFIMRKGHKTQLMSRINITMRELKSNGAKRRCMEHVIECCTHVNMITIFDINSNEEMDKYILYALLNGRTGDAQTSLLDQLGLALLWDRPDIAESHIFPAQPNWPPGALEDLMTTALLEEKVEFVKLFVVNGLVMADYLTVAKLRHLYNQACVPNSHLARMLQRSIRQLHNHNHHLEDIHNLLQVIMKQHHDPPYLTDTPEAAITQPAVSYLTFQDPYQELMLWAIMSRRISLARYLWQRCESPLCAAVAAACLYRALWRSLGAKNTDIRQEYFDNKVEFERLSVDLICQCYAQDSMNAMGLVERRNAKWGDMDCLELAYMGQNMPFISTPTAQASIELNWRRGMIRAPFYAVLIANICPLLIFWSKLFKFQKLGDNGGDLTLIQKLVVFYKSPISKFCAHSTIFVLFLLLYSYVVLFDFKYNMTLCEKFLLVWMATYCLDEISEIFSEQSNTVRGKLSDWSSNVWNRFDMVALSLASLALVLRLGHATFTWGRITYALNTTIFYVRLFRIYHINYHLGPKLVIFYRMISEILVFMALLIIFILGYGIASQALLHLNRNHASFSLAILSNITSDVLLTPYWQMYGELQLDELIGEDDKLCHAASCTPNAFATCAVDAANLVNDTCRQECLCENSKDYSWVVNVMLIFYLIVGNIMLLNMLIAIFTYVFDEVQENSMKIWKFEMFRLIREYDHKPALIPPFNALEYGWRVGKKLWKLFCRKKRENLDDYMKDTLESLRIFEKEVMQTYQARISHAEEASIENSIKRMSDKIDKIAKYIDQKEELEEIEEDLEWIMKEADELKQNKEPGTRPHTPQRPPTSSPWPFPPPPLETEKEEKEEEKEEAKDKREDSPIDEVLDVLTEELTDGDIEKELAHLQSKVVESRPYSGAASRAATPSLARYKVDAVSRRLDNMQQQLRQNKDSVEGMFKTVLARLDRIENKK